MVCHRIPLLLILLTLVTLLTLQFGAIFISTLTAIRMRVNSQLWTMCISSCHSLVGTNGNSYNRSLETQGELPRGSTAGSAFTKDSLISINPSRVLTIRRTCLTSCVLILKCQYLERRKGELKEERKEDKKE